MNKVEELLNKEDKVEPIKHYTLCKCCGKRYNKKEGHQKYCSDYCRQDVARKKARGCMRARRYKKTRGKCQVCNYTHTLDAHEEGSDVYILCPNHHALISRGIVKIEEYKILPVGKGR